VVSCNSQGQATAGDEPSNFSKQIAGSPDEIVIDSDDD
jgi:hypothetical protein